MRSAFYDRFRGYIPIKEEMIEEIEAEDFDKQKDLSVDYIIEGEAEYSQWKDPYLLEYPNM